MSFPKARCRQDRVSHACLEDLLPWSLLSASMWLKERQQWQNQQASPLWAARTASRTVPYFIQSATTGFIASIFPSRNRFSPKEAFEGPEPYDGKLSRPVLRGLAPSNGGWLLGEGFSPTSRLVTSPTGVCAIQPQFLCTLHSQGGI